MLETSVQDGILNSYAKLDAIDIQILSQTENSAKILPKPNGLRRLEIISKEYRHDVAKDKREMVY